MQILISEEGDDVGISKLFSIINKHLLKRHESPASTSREKPNDKYAPILSRLLQDTLITVSLSQLSQSNVAFLLDQVVKLNHHFHGLNQTQLLLDDSLQRLKDLTVLAYGSLISKSKSLTNREEEAYLNFMSSSKHPLENEVYFESLKNSKLEKSFLLLEQLLLNSTEAIIYTCP